MKWLLTVLSVILIMNSKALTETIILYGDKCGAVQKNAATDLVNDINRVCSNQETDISQYDRKKNYLSYNQLVFVGTVASHAGINDLVKKGYIHITADDPGPEAFILQTVNNYPQKGITTLVIAGNDDRGTYYGVYEFSNRILNIDPFEYWTGKTPVKLDKFIIPQISFREKSPVFPLRGYFDNDDDLIANWKERKLIVEFDTWKEMINSLARIRYNYIDLHDAFGRAEYWNWNYYRRMTNYHTDLELLDQIIDYAHSKGMLVQAPMYLGWAFYSLNYNSICLSEFHDEWMDVYEYYLTRSPIGKCDLFLQRPRDPWWDKAYNCSRETAAGIRPGPLMTKMFDGLSALVSEHRPGAKVVCDLWSEGRIMWRAEEFNPGKEIDILWADGGYGYYNEWPKDFKGHNFGIYIHAGYWLNHVMQDPYPEVIRESSLQAMKRGMTHNYLVNGQNFKNFILNLEACARASWDPDGFNPEEYYIEWSGRYFGEDAAPNIVESLKTLHEAHKPIGGFAKLMGNTVRMLKNMKRNSLEKVDLNPIKTARRSAIKSLEQAKEAERLVPKKSLPVYDDQIVFPAEIFVLNIEFALSAAKLMNAAVDAQNSSLDEAERKSSRISITGIRKKTHQDLIQLRKKLEKGSIWEKWSGWYKPEHFRVFTPPPTMGEIEEYTQAL